MIGLSMAVVVVESPAKAKTINKYLELGFTLYATEGTGKFLKTNGIDFA